MVSSATQKVIKRNPLRCIVSLDSGAAALEVGRKFNWSVGVAMEILQVYTRYMRDCLYSISYMKGPNESHPSSRGAKIATNGMLVVT